MPTDRTHMMDGVSASLEADPVPPKFPCPECGSESREYGEAERHDESQRICSSAVCREVQPAPKEVEVGVADEYGARFPCAKCGKETKVYQSGKIDTPRQRVCSNATCKNVFSP